MAGLEGATRAFDPAVAWCWVVPAEYWAVLAWQSVAWVGCWAVLAGWSVAWVGCWVVLAGWSVASAWERAESAACLVA